MIKPVTPAMKPDEPGEPEPWHSFSPQGALEHLQVREQGLTAQEAAERLAIYGHNQLLEAPRPGFLHMLWGQINNFVVILLIVAALISALLGDYMESSAILAIVILNAVLGILQERRAEEALAALKKMAAPEEHVLPSRPSAGWPPCHNSGA